MKSSGRRQEIALAELREIIRPGLPFALSKWLPSGDPGFDALAEETTQETLIRVLDKIDFDHRSVA